MLTLANIRDQIYDLIWPPICAVTNCTNKPQSTNRHLCASCFASLPFIDAKNVCPVCGLPFGFSLDEHSESPTPCESCQKFPPPFTCAKSVTIYNPPISELIQDFKFHRAIWLCEDFTDLLESVVRTQLPLAEIDVIVPIPLHPKRLRERGYNQSALLAENLAHRLNLRYETHAFQRLRDTKHQARLTGDKRRNNLDNAFKCTESAWLQGRTVLLIDDVMTTGTTLSKATEALKAAGVPRVYCLTIARAVLN